MIRYGVLALWALVILSVVVIFALALSREPDSAAIAPPSIVVGTPGGVAVDIATSTPQPTPELAAVAASHSVAGRGDPSPDSGAHGRSDAGAGNRCARGNPYGDACDAPAECHANACRGRGV